jgi:hypothetical protein
LARGIFPCSRATVVLAAVVYGILAALALANGGRLAQQP